MFYVCAASLRKEEQNEKAYRLSTGGSHRSCLNLGGVRSATTAANADSPPTHTDSNTSHADPSPAYSNAPPPDTHADSDSSHTNPGPPNTYAHSDTSHTDPGPPYPNTRPADTYAPAASPEAHNGAARGNQLLRNTFLLYDSGYNVHGGGERVSLY